METWLLTSERETIDEFLTCPSEESYGRLFRAFAPRMFRFFRTHGCDACLAEDLTQEVMLAVHRRSAKLRDRQLFRPWVYRIARNALLQHLRQAGRRVELVDMDSRTREPSAAATDPLRKSRLAEWMALLESDERQMMIMHYVEGLEYHEIAAVLRIPMGTVQWKVFRAKRKLVAHYGGRPA
jgi:RNA polymerase sigma-70 factor, ECF subfamily